VVVDNLDVLGGPGIPSEADPPLIVDSDTPLPFPIATQLLETVRWRYSQVFDPHGSIDHEQPAERGTLNVGRQFTRTLAGEKLGGLTVCPAADHPASINATR